MALTRFLKRNEGQALVLTAFALVVLIGVSALAIDLGMAYAVKAKLNSAVDAASLAAGKAVKNGADDATRKLNATNAANSFFAANFPTALLGTADRTFSVNKLENNSGTWTISVSASATAPVFFGRMFNLPITVATSAEVTVKTLDMMIVLDCSGSLGASFPALQTAAKNFVAGFQEGNGGDRIGLVTFASGAVLDDPINKDANRGFSRANLTGHINAASMGGATNAEEAMRIAKAELDAIPTNVRSTLRVIVFFSDGAPNIVSGNFTLRNNAVTPSIGVYSVQSALSDDPADYYAINSRTSTVQCYKKNATYTQNVACNQNGYTYISKLPATDYTGTVNLASFNNARTLAGNPVTNTWCNANKAARNMVENIANAARDGAGNAAITIYSIGLGNMLGTNEVTNCAYGSSEYGSNILKRIANTADSDMYQASQPTGLYVWAADASQLNSAFQKVKSIILRLSK